MLKINCDWIVVNDYFSAAGFNQYGLYHDDALYENDDVKEALKRVPQVCLITLMLILELKLCNLYTFINLPLSLTFLASSG